MYYATLLVSPKICRRFKRDIRSGYFEALSTRFFLDGGYEIFARPEVGKKGEDFDFYAVRGDETINVEVTAVTSPNFSEETALDRLNAKREQLPKRFPALIYCIFPDAWWYPVELIRPRMDAISRRFFGSTERVNAIVIMGEDPTPWNGTDAGILAVGILDRRYCLLQSRKFALHAGNRLRRHPL